MKEFLEAAIAFFAELTWKRFRGVLILFCVIAVMFGLFDSYTSYFTLSRLSRSAELIVQVQAIEANTAKRTPELEQAYKSLCGQVLEAVSAKPWTLRMTPPSTQVPYSRLWKFLAAVAPWLLFSLIMIPDILRRKPNAWHGILGVSVIAICFGFIGLILPTFYWPWFNLVIFPLAAPVLFFIVMLVVGMASAQKKRNEEAQSNAEI